MTPTSVWFRVRRFAEMWRARGGLTQAESFACAVRDEASVITDVEYGNDPMHDGSPTVPGAQGVSEEL
jgi:hypothetical protein